MVVQERHMSERRYRGIHFEMKIIIILDQPKPYLVVYRKNMINVKSWISLRIRIILKKIDDLLQNAFQII